MHAAAPQLVTAEFEVQHELCVQYMTSSTVPQLVTAELKCNTNCAGKYMICNT